MSLFGSLFGDASVPGIGGIAPPSATSLPTPPSQYGGMFGTGPLDWKQKLALMLSSVGDAANSYRGAPSNGLQNAIEMMRQRAALQRQQQQDAAFQNTAFDGDAQAYVQKLVSAGVPIATALQVASNRRSLQGVRTLSPAESKAKGYRGVVQESPSGEDSIVQTPDTLSPEAVQQKLDILKQTPMTAYERANLGQSQAELKEKTREFNASNPLLMGGNAPSESSDLSKYPLGVRNMVRAMLEGRQAPPSSFALKTPYWQNMMMLANAVDPQFDQTTWAGRVGARKDMLGGGKSYQLLNSGNTAIQHLGRLHSQIGDVSGVQFPLVGNLVNSAVNATEQASGVPGVPAYNDTLNKLAQETTKFYRGTGGAEADVTRNMETLSPNLSTEQKRAGVANTVHLIFGALQPKVEQYNKVMNTNFPASHFLSHTSINVLRSMGFDPDTGEALAPAKGLDAHTDALLGKYGIK